MDPYRTTAPAEPIAKHATSLATRTQPILEVRSLYRRFGERQVLANFSLEAAAGQKIGIRGPNGSGKTTLLRCIAGTITATSGEIRIGGYAGGSLEARRRTGISLSQERSFYMRLSGRENLLLFARLRGLTKTAAAERVEELTTELELEEIVSQRADRCSSGQLQQLALARALVGDPEIVLLDEPTRSLDAEARARLWAVLARRPQIAALVATHLDEDIGHVTSVVELRRPS